jgi:hypothetical protein
LLLNIALHGLEEAAGVRYRGGIHAGTVKDGCPALIRYADDLVVCCHSRQQAEQVRARLAEWLEPRGLAFNEAKTRIVPVTDGFDFLGFNLRLYPNGKLLIKPGAMAIKRFRERLAKEFRALRGANIAAVLAKIVPITQGWVAYYRTVVSSRVFAALTDYLWKLTYKWACWSHPNKPKRWITGRYFGKFNKFRNDRWVFGDRDTGAYLPKPSWTDIGVPAHRLPRGRPGVARHQRGGAPPSPDDLAAACDRARDTALAALAGAGLDGDEALALAEGAAQGQDDESGVPARYAEHDVSRYPAQVSSISWHLLADGYTITWAPAPGGCSLTLDRHVPRGEHAAYRGGGPTMQRLGRGPDAARPRRTASRRQQHPRGTRVPARQRPPVPRRAVLRLMAVRERLPRSARQQEPQADGNVPDARAGQAAARACQRPCAVPAPERRGLISVRRHGQAA